MRTPYGAFTLLELLVTLTIIALLLALLIPAISAFRASAKNTACGANLRGIGVALHAYKADFNDFPAACLMPDPFPARLADGPPIYVPLAPYIPPTSKIYRCPTDFQQVSPRPPPPPSTPVPATSIGNASIARLPRSPVPMRLKHSCGISRATEATRANP